MALILGFRSLSLQDLINNNMFVLPPH
jgi:hypothetical protein